MQVTDVLQWVTNITFVTAAIAALRIWLRRRDSSAARWLAITFGIIAVIILSTLGLDEDAEIPRLVLTVLLAGIVVFPWALFRFADALTGHRPLQVRLVTAVTLVVVAWGFFLPELPEQDEPLTPAFTAYLVALLVAWGLGTALSAWRLFRAGAGTPGVVRNRMRLLSAGSLLLTIVLLASSLDSNGAAQEDGALAIVTGIVTLLAAGAFLTGFAPPPILRAWWRRHDELELHRSIELLLRAESPTEVASIMLPPFRRLVGAEAIQLTGQQGAELGSLGPADAFTNTPAWRILESGGDELTVRAVMSETAPLFGQDERDLAERLLLIAGLAIDRAKRAYELELSNRSLTSANEELESFVYSASHDLKNPLISLLSYVDLVKNQHVFEEGSEVQRFMERIEANGWFMSSLIQDLLELSRVGRVEEHEAPVDLAEVIAAAQDTLAVQYPTLRVTVQGRLPTVLMSPTRAAQLVTNMVANAGAHGGDGVELTITAELDMNEGLTRIVFQDDGPGIDPNHAQRIFRVFERLNPAATDGSGIGLAICRKIAQSIDGDMFLEPSPVGARFVLTVPPAHVVGPTPEPTRATTPAHGPVSNDTPTVTAEIGTTT